MHINPDHFLQTATGRVVTPERNREAWKQSFVALEAALARATSLATLFVMVGAQGSGKSRWAKARDEEDVHAIIFDAILVKVSERLPLLEAARRHGVKAVAVWLQTPLAACLSRNAGRALDEVVPEQAVRNVFAALEPPTSGEGFDQVVTLPYAESDG